MTARHIVSWSPRLQTPNGGSNTPVKWHILKGEASDEALCEEALPDDQHRNYAEIHTEQLTHIKGFCFTCFHCLCIEQQSVELWDLFGRTQKIRDGLLHLHTEISNAKCSAEDRIEALKLLAMLSKHSVTLTLTGED